MNLTDYFEPYDFSKLKSGKHPPGKYTLGTLIEKTSSPLNEKSLVKSDIVLFGVPVDNGKRQKKGSSSPDAIRNVLYRMAEIETRLKIIDLGNLKITKSHKGTLLALRDITEYLLELNVIIVVMGGSQELTIGISEAFRDKRLFWLSTIDPVLDIKKGTEPFNSGNYLTQLFKRVPNIFQFSLIGYQQQHTSEKVLDKIMDIGNNLRLGELRNDIKQAELLLRNTHFLSFDIRALKHSEIPEMVQTHPNGLRGEEACKLAHYAGLSPGIKVFGLFETSPDMNGTITIALAAEIIWYFLKGVTERSQGEIKTIYKVEIEGLDHPVVFRHEWELNRWWFDVHSVSGEVTEIACSEEDYKKAALNEIPERWLNYLQKMDKLLK